MKVTIPTEIRKRHNIKTGDKLVWVDDGQSIRVILTAAVTSQVDAKEQGVAPKLLEESAKDQESEL